ncbi:MAG: hypothetical protein V4447_15800 [Pseudomonadota bacterium]
MFSEIKSIFNAFLVIGVMFGGSGMLYRYLTGWSQLSTLYARRESVASISDGSYRWVSCKINLTPISVSIEIYPDGLWLKPGFPLSVFMPAILIPGSKIVMAKSKTGLFGRKTELQIAGFSGPFVICGNAGLAITDSINSLAQ